MDTALIEEVARLRPEWHWVLVGRKSNLVQISAPNVHFVGPKPYSDLPGYVRRFDVCVLPWRLDKAFTSYGSAIKVQGIPGDRKTSRDRTPLRVLRCSRRDHLSRHQEFIAAEEEALHHDSARARALRQSVVRNCTWDIRARQVAELISSLLKSGTNFQCSIPQTHPLRNRRFQFWPPSSTVDRHIASTIFSHFLDWRHCLECAHSWKTFDQVR